MRYVPYGELDGVPNVVVDGARHPDSVLVLSHWPKSGSPKELRADLSAQIAFGYLDRPDRHVDADAVSNNHFDQDGMMSMYALVDPDAARARRDRAIDVARMGDFDTYEDRASAHIAWTIAALAAEAEAAGGDPYAELLPRTAELLDHPDGYREHWAEEDEHLARSEAAVASGVVAIDEVPELDLAVVTVPDDWSPKPAHFFTPIVEQAVHATAVHNATDRSRILYLRGDRYLFQYRYETWVQLASRRPLQRVDLTALAEELSADEPGDTRWVFDPIGAIAPALHLVAAGDDPASAVAPERFRERLTRALVDGPPAWDPYDD
jgi:hypothetical protein